MIVIDLIYNLAILIAISILAGFIDKRWHRNTIKGQIIQGFLFGFTAIIGMLQPFVIAEGIFFDGRTVILSLCALFFGPVPAFIAASFAIIYRIYIGGGGLIMGLSTIISATIIGLIYYHLRKNRSLKITTLNLLLMGFGVHLIMILFMFTLPSKMQLVTIQSISITIIIAFPLATILIGKILKDQEDNEILLSEIKASESKYRLLVENQSDLIIKTDREGRFIYVSNSYCKTFDKKENELLGNIFFPLFHEEDWESTHDAIVSLKIEPHKFYIEHRVLTINGWRWIGWAAQANIDKNNEIQFIVAVGRDVTVRKENEEKIKNLNEHLEDKVLKRTAQLEEANKELEAFSYSVSHDLRAPLRAINGFTKILFEDYSKKLDNEGNRLLQIVRSNTNKMEILITDLLELSRTNRAHLKLNDVDMAKLVETIFSELKLINNHSDLNFIINDLPHALADYNLMRQVWVNLISNAIKYTHPKSNKTIEIGGYKEKKKNIYYIKDSGVGFNPELKNKLFGVFQRLHTNEEFEGTGVGLAIVYRIIKRHGGDIWAESKLNEGATFWFSLPITSDHIKL